MQAILSVLMHVVIVPLLKCKSKDPADINNYRPIAIATALTKVLQQVLLCDSDGTCGLQKSHGTEKAIFTVE